MHEGICAFGRLNNDHLEIFIHYQCRTGKRCGCLHLGVASLKLTLRPRPRPATFSLRIQHSFLLFGVWYTLCPPWGIHGCRVPQIVNVDLMSLIIYVVQFLDRHCNGMYIRPPLSHYISGLSLHEHETKLEVLRSVACIRRLRLCLPITKITIAPNGLGAGTSGALPIFLDSLIHPLECVLAASINCNG